MYCCEIRVKNVTFTVNEKGLGKKKTDWELFDLKKDPNELHNLIGRGNKNEKRLRKWLKTKSQ